MSQDKKYARIADDYTAIAARMRELNAQPTQLAVRRKCDVCDNIGWLWSRSGLDRRRCPYCGVSECSPKPKSRL